MILNFNFIHQPTYIQMKMRNEFNSHLSEDSLIKYVDTLILS